MNPISLFHSLLDMHTLLKLWIYQSIIIDLWIKSFVPATRGMQNNIYYGLMTSICNAATLTLIMFMLQITE